MQEDFHACAYFLLIIIINLPYKTKPIMDMTAIVLAFDTFAKIPTIHHQRAP